MDEETVPTMTRSDTPAKRSLARRLLKGRVLSLASIAVVVAALVGMLLFGVVSKGAKAIVALEGKQAPDFRLELYDGGTLTLSELRGTPVVVNFWASWCPSCRDEAPGVEKVWREYKDRGVLFVGISVKDKEEDARAFLKEFNISYPNGPDTTNRISVNYGLTGVPESTFINREGIAVHNHIGPMTLKQLRSYVEEILQ